MAALQALAHPTTMDHRPRYRVRQERKHAIVAHSAALLLFTLLTLLSALEIVFHPASTVTPDLIDPVHHIWSVASIIHTTMAWRDGLWSVFDGNIFYPTPHAASFADTFLGLLPLLLPLSLVIHDPAVLANILAGLSFVLSAYGAFLLGWTLTRRYVAGIVAGLVFGFCPLHVEQIGHVTVASMQWQSLAAYALVTAWRRPSWRWWALAGLLLGLGAATNLYYLAYLTGPLVIAAATLGRRWTGARLRGAALAISIATIITAPTVIPYLTRHADIGPGYGAGSTDLFSFVQVLSHRPIDALIMPAVPFAPMQVNHGLFPGIMPLFLALVAWRRRRRRAWGVFALGCAILALGPYLAIDGHTLSVPLPYELASRLVPHFALFRDPTRALAGFYLGLAVLAGWGTRHVLSHARTPRQSVALSIAVIGIVALEVWTPLPVAHLPPIPAGEYWLARQASIHAIVELPIANATPLDWQRQTEIMRDSTVHWKQMVNGSESVDPTGMAQETAVLATYPSPASLRLLRRLHIDAVVLRLPWLPAAARAHAQAGCHSAYRDRVEEICVPPWTALSGKAY